MKLNSEIKTTKAEVTCLRYNNTGNILNHFCEILLLRNKEVTT
jgi:hypothetical protein